MVKLLYNVSEPLSSKKGIVSTQSRAVLMYLLKSEFTR